MTTSLCHATFAALLALTASCASTPSPPPRAAVTPAVPAVVTAPSVTAPSVEAPVAAAPVVEPVRAAEPVAAPTPEAHHPMYRGRSEDEWLRLMHERPVLRTVEVFFSTLHVYRMDLGDGVEISFQPAQERLEPFWRHEVASYHLARVLGIENRAPPTIGKRVPLAAFGRFARRVELIVDRDGMVAGSASVWVPTLNAAHMHEAPARRVWSSWMNPVNPIPETSRERARQVAEVLVFDYLAANYDRWNCCNIALDERDDLVFRDNDAGWFPSVIGRLGSPRVTRRVPRYLFESVQRATTEAIRASIAQDPMASRYEYVSRAAYAGYELRRSALIASLRRAIAEHGEAAVLYWP